MKPRGLLMIEHRTIEKMLALAEKEARRIEETNEADPVFIEVVVDFIQTYADRTHHGKEEEILFERLAAMKLDDEDRRQMEDLVDEHRRSREKVRELGGAAERYLDGDSTETRHIISLLRWLADFYPKHIVKEDKTFFPRTERYFDEVALEQLLRDFYEFDRAMIHEKYNAVVESLEKRFSEG